MGIKKKLALQKENSVSVLIKERETDIQIETNVNVFYSYILNVCFLEIRSEQVRISYEW
jgi:hypothetical protein